MQILKYILIALYVVNCFAVIIITMMQSKQDSGLSATITGSSTNNFYEKNKGRTKEGKQKRILMFSSILLAVLSIVLGILYLA